MSFADQGGSEKIVTRSAERVVPDRVATYEIHTVHHDHSSNLSLSRPQLITANMVRTRQINENQSPDVPTMEQSMNEDMAANNESTANESTASVDTHQDSYMGNGADESGNVSGASGIGETTGIVIRVLPTIDGGDTSSRASDIAEHASFTIKPDGKSYKYPELKKFFQFGPWVGRNRKAICVRCKHESASSQPERLIKHMRKCSQLSDEDKSLADTLLLESSSNKRSRSKKNKSDSEYFADLDDPHMLPDDAKAIRLPGINPKRLKKAETADRKAQIDQALARWIICCRIPLRTVHSKEFVEFVRALDPEYRLPSRENITNVLIPSLLNII